MISIDQLRKLLVEPGHMSENDFNDEAKKAPEDIFDFWNILVDGGHIKDQQLGKLLADDLNIPLIDLGREKVDEKILRLIPEVVAFSKGVVALSKQGEFVKVAMLDPTDIETRHNIEKRIGEKCNFFLITKKDLQKVLEQYSVGLKAEVEEIISKLEKTGYKDSDDGQSIISIVEKIINYGQRNGTSDIHIEPFEKKILVRFRIDGVLHDVLEIPKELGDEILSRIKIISRMRIDEHMAAQDGKFKFKTSGVEGEKYMDVRVSIVPVTGGENVVMRLLSSSARRFSLQDLGLEGEELEKVKKTIKNPHGMILVTGPTGSGKTTTLYAVLKILNTREVHISTIEDPVEYDVPGISQIQVNPRTDLTFAKGLRSIVRQDPDIIMVGEIRDKETAGIAVNSALTGHLVLSTLHTNDAATTLPRLQDMGVEPYLISSTVNVVIAQRLVRKICQSCRASTELSPEEKEIVKNDPEIKSIFEKLGHKKYEKTLTYRGSGCKVCHNSGYAGRLGIFEVLHIDEQIKKLIQDRASNEEINKMAKKNGMKTMLEDGISKVLNGVTTLDEVLRVTHEVKINNEKE